ncbi:MAG TPA: hypothetical protein GX520_09070 [Syntrophaceticus sp.]|nr:hypothetical protein [Syntrophaceticus sp.]
MKKRIFMLIYSTLSSNLKMVHTTEIKIGGEKSMQKRLLPLSDLVKAVKEELHRMKYKGQESICMYLFGKFLGNTWTKET